MEFIEIARLWLLLSFTALLIGCINLLVFNSKNREHLLNKNNRETDEVVVKYKRKQNLLFFILVLQGVGLCLLHFWYEGGIKWLITGLFFALAWPLFIWLQSKS